MKKSMALALCLMLCAVMVLAGCSKSNDNAGGNSSAPSSSPTAAGASDSGSTTAPAANSGSPSPAASAAVKNSGVQLTPTGTFPITNEKVTLKVFLPQDPSIENLDTNLLTQEYEQKTNVHIVWETASRNNNELLTKENLLLASNSDMPDIFLNAALSNAQLVQYGSEGVLLPLNDLIARDAPNFQKVLQYKPIIGKMITAPDGKIYALPSISETYHTTMGQKLWINQTWLNKLNLKMPTTTQEFYDVMKAFKDDDPNGNGKADEIPLTGAITGYNTQVYHFLMNAFIQDQGLELQKSDQIPLDLTNGKVTAAFATSQWQEGLRYLHKLYADGLLDPGALTQNAQQLQQLAANKDAELLGAVTAGAITGFISNGTPRMYDYLAVPPLKGPDGTQTEGYYPYSGVQTGKFAISASSKYPDVAMRWVDWFFSQEGTLRSNAGREGTEWRYGNPGEVGINGKQATFIRLLKFGKTQNVHWNQNVPIFLTEDFRNGDVADPKDQETILYNETKNKYEPYKPAEVLPPLFMTTDENEEYLSIDTPLRTYLQETMAKFVSGDMDVDKDWDSYLKQLDNIGLKRYIELVQGAYNREYGNQ